MLGNFAKKIILLLAAGAVVLFSIFLIMRRPNSTAPSPVILPPASSAEPTSTLVKENTNEKPPVLVVVTKPSSTAPIAQNKIKPVVSPTTTPTASTTKSVKTPIATNGPEIGGCAIFPLNNSWNEDVSSLPVLAMSATYINSIGAGRILHPDFGEDQTYGIPYNVVPGTQKMVPITFTDYGDESDPGPYPIPDNAKVESGSDAHVLTLDTGSCKLYELYGASKNNQGGWNAASGAVFDLKSNALRPEGWTSTDAAGLPILPGLVRYDELAAGVINHAIRFTAPRTQNGWINPATHQAGSSNPDLPPMGLRLRLKADYDISGFSGEAKVILVAMKKYGIILADNGSAWFFQGATDPRWHDDELSQLKKVPGSAFEAVDTGLIHH